MSPWSVCPCGQYPQCPYLGARMCKHCAEKGTLACMMTTLDSHTCICYGVYAYMKLWHSMQETGYFRLLSPFYNDPSVDFDLTQQNEWWLLLMMPRLLPPFVCAQSPWQRVALYGQFVLRTWSKRVLRHWDTLPRLVCVMPQTMATNSANIGYNGYRS